MGKAKDEFRLKVVREALSGIKIGVLARTYDLHPETIRTWTRNFRDQIGEDELTTPDQHLQELKRLQEVEEKYERAMKVLGEKELENEILRELLKKKNPAYLKNLK